MKNVAASGIVAFAGVAGTTSGQDMIVYEFEIEVVSNAIADNISEGDLASLEIGTTGILRFVVNSEPGDYPDWNIDDQALVYDIHEISLVVGGIDTNHQSGIYPTTSPVLGMNVTNDVWYRYSDRTRFDSLSSVFVLDHPEIALCVLNLAEVGEPHQFPQLLTNTDLPLSADLNIASSRTLAISPLIAGVEWKVMFDVIALEGNFLPSCPVDVNRDGMVSPTDFTAWISAFNNNLPACDQNGDFICSPTDFTAWIANYNSGCA
jgi:hypothetical protein